MEPKQAQNRILWVVFRSKRPLSLLFPHIFMSHWSYSSRIFDLQYLPFKMWCSNYQRLAQSSGKVTEENLPGISLGGGSARREEEDWFGFFRLGSEAGNACHGRGEAHWHSLRDEWRRWRMREREREREWVENVLSHSAAKTDVIFKKYFIRSLLLKNIQFIRKNAYISGS